MTATVTAPTPAPTPPADRPAPSTGRRIAVVLLVAALAALLVNLGLAATRSITGGERGPVSSSYATGPYGLSDWARLLERTGHRVVRQGRPIDVQPPEPDATVVLLDAPKTSPDEAAALRRHVGAGGRLIVGGEGGDDWLRAVEPDAPRIVDRKGFVARPVAPASELSGVSEVELAGAGTFSSVEGSLPLLACNGVAVAAAESPGDGRVVFLADATPLQNRLLGVRSNAAFAVGIAGSRTRTVVFVEHPHGHADATGLAGLPGGVQVALLGLALAGLALLVDRRRRPPVAAGAVPTGRVDHALAVARRIGEGGSRSRARAIQDAAQAAVFDAAGLPPGASAAEAAAAATALGLTPQEVEAVAATKPTSDQLVLAGRVVARLARR